MNHILVPCDFSKPSQEAFKFALSIAAKTKGKITVLHAIYIPAVYDATFSGGMTPAFDPIYLTTIEEDAKKEFQKMKQNFPSGGTTINLEITYGELISAIKQQTETQEIDLVVMGASGTTRFKTALIGSNTEKVVRHSTIPVFAVHTAPDINSIKKILLPFELKLDQIEFMNKVKKIQSFFNATLQILLINTPAHFQEDKDVYAAFEEFAKHYKLDNYAFYFRNYLNEEDGILDFAHNEKIDLIVMGTHARKGLSHLFNGSITEDIISTVKYPIWTYHLKS